MKGLTLARRRRVPAASRLALVMTMVVSLLVLAPPAHAALPDVGFLVATSSPGEGVGSVNVTIELTTDGTPLVAPLVFDVVDAGTGTATGPDYTFVQPAPSLQFDIGDNTGATRVVPVTITQDSTDEPDQTIVLQLQPVSGGDIDPAADTHTLTIVDDDAAPVMSIDDVGVNEGVVAAFTVSLSAASEKTVSAQYQTANGSAAAGSDYTAVGPATVTFNPGVVSRPINVPTTVDGLYEGGGTETFTVDLSALSNATGTELSGLGTITDTTPQPTISINDASAVTEGGSANFTVSLSGPSASTITVNYATANGTAIAPGDYTAISSTQLTFTPGQTSKPVSVTTIDDAFDEPATETFTVNLSSPSGATILDGSGTGTINDNDGPPAISIDDVTVTEGDTASFTVTMTNPSVSTITVNYATANGTAIAPGDYTAISSTQLTFTPGQTSKTINVTTIDDDVYDGGPETFTVNLSGVSAGATISDGSGTGTINDNDAARTLSISDATAVTEGAVATFTVTLSGASDSNVTVNYATANGSAVAPGDYTAITSTQLTFTPGQTSKVINVSTINDLLDENDGETFTVSLSSESGATVTRRTATGSINDNDAPPTVSIADTSLAEGGGAMTFGVTLSAASGRQITVNYATTGGSAVAGDDYTATSGTLTFLAGATTPITPLTVTILDDNLNEGPETIGVTLSGLVNVTAGTLTATGTINDDDPLPQLSVNSVSSEEGNVFTFTVTLSAPSGREVRVNRATANVTAVAPGDYTALASSTLVFAPGETTKSVVVTTNDDASLETNETFRVVLSTPVNATIPVAFGTGTILDNDGPPGLSAVGAPTATEGTNGSLVFTVSLLPAAGVTVEVDFGTANGTAIAPGDYTAVSGTLTFDPGETSKEVLIPIVNDSVDEIDETVRLNLSNPFNATIATSQAEGTIADNDNVAPVASIHLTDIAGNPSVTFNTSETVRLYGEYEDPGVADPHSVTIDWGDGTPATEINITPVTEFSFSSTHTYAAPGAYTISATVRDEVENGETKTGVVFVEDAVDGQTIGLVDRTTGRWYLYNSAGALAWTFYFGNPGDYPFMGDWNGDGIETPGLYRQSDGFVYLRNSNTQGVADIRFFFGNPGDVPIAGDFNGDGFDTVSIYRPSNQTFYIINKLGANDGGLGAAETSYVFGNPGDKPFVGDFNNDGVETVGLHRETTGLVYYRNTHTAGNAHNQFLFGDPGDRLVAGDWNGNGTFTPALFRPSSRTMYFRYTNTQGNADHQWTGGQSGWFPVSGSTGF